ncbi:hypothetical protein GHT06_010066 [Daphnia sinensis]|uniref:RING-type domain-containing protein n=1 Tax=Daphnia sinensis TaxID=1820382 RepID=A0AAD5L0E1_9CRUS|nr:hypothetical protein GHT06_010066 [Daphnia sinensis]
MSRISESVDSTIAQDNEDFISCSICFINFDEKERVPKYLEKCYHFFCLPCIKDLSGPGGRNKIACPVCRSTSSLSRTKCEQLVTNHVALRLLKVVESSHAKAEKAKKQLWCKYCNFIALDACLHEKHKTCDNLDVFNNRSQLLKSKISETNSTCDEALRDCHKIQSIHQVVLAWIRWLELEITHRDASIIATISQLDCLKSTEVFDVSVEADMPKTISHIVEFIDRFTEKSSEAKAMQLDVLDILHTYSSAQQDSEYLAHFSSDASPTDLVSWFKGPNCFKVETNSSQCTKQCVKILAFLITLLSGEFSNSGNDSEKNTSGSGKNNVEVNGDLKTNDCLKKGRGGCEKIEKTCENDEPRPSCSGMQQRSKRLADNQDAGTRSLKKCRWMPPTRIDVVMEKHLTHESRERLKTSANGLMCYFRFLIDDKPSERVIFELDDQLAPIMASKFREFCTGKIPPGYQGSIVFPPHVGLNGLPASNSIPSLRGGQIVDHENLLFIADVSILPPKLGSVFFTVKEDNVWGTLVSPEFQILLGEPKWETKTTSTVFGHVVDGLHVLNRISKIHQVNKSKFATVIDCGVVELDLVSVCN